MLGLGTPGKLPNYGISAAEAPTGGWRSRTASQAQNIGTQAATMGLNTMGAGGAAIGLPINYWAAILSGNPQAAMQAASPAVSSVLKQYDTARQSAAELAPRGGGQITTMTQAPYQEAGTVGGILSQAQQQAAAGMTTNAQLLGQLGTYETQLGTDAIRDTLSTILSEEEIGIKRNAGIFDQAVTMGEGLAGMFAGL
jgi:hypothetical protein